MGEALSLREDVASIPPSSFGGLGAWSESRDASNPAMSNSISLASNIRGDSAGGVSGIGGVALGGSGRVVTR